MVMWRCGGAESLQGTNRRHRWEDDRYEPSQPVTVRGAGSDACRRVPPAQRQAEEDRRKKQDEQARKEREADKKKQQQKEA